MTRLLTKTESPVLPQVELAGCNREFDPLVKNSVTIHVSELLPVIAITNVSG